MFQRISMAPGIDIAWNHSCAFCSTPIYIPWTLMASAAADVINHNGRKIGRFKPIRFCYARMTSAQSWIRCHHWFEPTSSLPIFKRLYLVIYKTLALIFMPKVQAEICMFTQQNCRCFFNRPSLFPLWLMTSVAADVISVPGVNLQQLLCTF